MNTNDDKIQWHPAFDAALQIELEDEAEYLEFEPEHLLSKKPMQIDVLVKNEKDVKIKKNIGRIFRQYNIIEYKSPDDKLNIDDFYKIYGYACLYKSETGDVDQIPATELTITFVCYHYPVKMLQKLKYDKKMSIKNIEINHSIYYKVFVESSFIEIHRNGHVKNIENGIYYLIGDLIPIQLIIIPKLSKENNYWLNNLRNDLKSGGEIRNFIEQYGKKKESKLYQALADTIMRANWKELKEERRMCQALRELFADDLRESELKGRNAGKREGKIEGKMEAKIELIIKKYKKGCSAEETADMLEEPINLMRQIYEMLDQYTPDYDVEKIYKGLLEKAILPV